VRGWIQKIGDFPFRLLKVWIAGGNLVATDGDGNADGGRNTSGSSPERNSGE
jgi:hypothetical protein